MPKYLFFITIAFLCTNLFGQKCNFALSGIVVEKSKGEVVPDTYVYIEELSIGVMTNEKGEFKFPFLCAGDYHLNIDHVGCETKHVFLHFTASEQIDVVIEHYVQMLDGVHLLGHKSEVTTQSVQSIGYQNIQKNANENLGNLLEGLTGVSTLKNGSGIAKPVVHGMYGNRVMVLNNGVVQSGQQWGNDHSPEIDPMVANNIKVIKGVGALEYQGSSLGSFVSVEPKEISDDPHLHGASNSFYESNGNGVGLNFTLEKSDKYFDWRLVGTLKKFGDRSASNYYLTNTGSGEVNLALQLKKQWNSDWLTKAYLSSFNTELGVLKGSHISTESDLESALIQDRPFNTKGTFSYEIESPRQLVNHHLLKVFNQYRVSANETYEFIYSGQLNLRQEFDIRTQGKSDVPAMKINQNTHNVEVKHKHIVDQWKLKQGVQYTFTNNTNSNGETGLKPLIPDYLSHQLGVFGLATLKKNSWMYELGARYNFTYQNAAVIKQILKTSATTGNEYLQDTISKYNNYFHTIGLSSGIRYRTQKDLHWAFNVGITSRNPAINELYSNGLHQGVAAIEIGNSGLKQETGAKATLGLEGDVAQKLFFESLVYYQYINDYIFLNPLTGDDGIDSTTRGVYRVYEYDQTNAEIFGLDVAVTYQFTDNIKTKMKYSFLRGNNLSENIPLINMPANNLLANIDYNLPKFGYFTNNYVGVDYKYVWEQTHYKDGQDFIDPPNAYQLMGLKIGTTTKWKNTKIDIYSKATNVLNISYRDYLNRLRYFADENGRSITIGVKFSF